jgi:hypothetical protein
MKNRLVVSMVWSFVSVLALGCTANVDAPVTQGGKGGGGGTDGGTSSGGAAPTRAGGDKGAAAKTSNQKSGGRAAGAQSQATDRGTEVDGILCDVTTEGLAWCDSDTTIVFCAGGDWYELNCSAIEADAFCGLELPERIVDCFVEVD